MPRPPRFDLPGVPRHIVQRGNNRQSVFFDETDYRAYLEWLGKAVRHYGVAVHAWCLIPTPYSSPGNAVVVTCGNVNYGSRTEARRETDGLATGPYGSARRTSIPTVLQSRPSDRTARAPCTKWSGFAGTARKARCS